MSTEHTPPHPHGEDIGRRTDTRARGLPASDHDQRERARYRARVPSSERLFQVAFDRAEVGIMVISLQGLFLRCNQRLCDIVGYAHEELAVRTLQDVTYPDDRDANRTAYQRLLAGELDAYDGDKRFIRKDGASIWVHLTVSLVRTRAGAPDYCIATAWDITDRKRLEQERTQLFEQERLARTEAEGALARAVASEARAAERAERLRAILETMTDGVGVYDQVGRIVQSNRAYRDLLAAQRIPGFDAIPLADRAPLFDMRDAATGEPLSLDRFPVTYALRGETATGPIADIRIRALDGRELEANISAAPLRDSDGCVVGAVSVIHDVTWRRLLEHEREVARAHELALMELNRRKDEFLSILSHELRTPLTSILGYMQLLNCCLSPEGLQAPGHEQGAEHRERELAKARMLLAYAEVSLQRLTRLAEDLIDDMRIREGRLTLHLAACELGAIVSASVEEQRAMEAHRTIHMQLPNAQPVLVIADAERIGQVVTNYLTNALKYSKEDTPIEVRLQVEQDIMGMLARVSVRDDGPGLSRPDQQHLFELFPQIEGTAVQSGSGVSLGLGLYLCKAIIQAHGGQVGVESELGYGSSFYFTLPLASASSHAESGPD